MFFPEFSYLFPPSSTRSTRIARSPVPWATSARGFWAPRRWGFTRRQVGEESVEICGIFGDFYGWFLWIFWDFDGKSEKIFGDVGDDWWWFIRNFMDLLGFIVMWICGFLEDDLYGFRMNCGTPRFTCETFSLVPYDIWIYMDYSDVKSVNICNIHI